MRDLLNVGADSLRCSKRQQLCARLCIDRECKAGIKNLYMVLIYVGRLGRAQWETNKAVGRTTWKIG